MADIKLIANFEIRLPSGMKQKFISKVSSVSETRGVGWQGEFGPPSASHPQAVMHSASVTIFPRQSQRGVGHDGGRKVNIYSKLKEM